MPPWAEVIGDPIAHSRSPAIHKAWLAALGRDGDYRPTRIGIAGLQPNLAARRADPDWRGCNVTAPLKQAILPLLDRLDPAAAGIGAVNCVVREGDALVGYNSDVEGIAASLAGVDLAGRRAVVIGNGGAARAARWQLRTMRTSEVVTLARSEGVGLDRAGETLSGAALVVNATPLGMAHANPMPATILAALEAMAPGATVFDMIYDPADSLFLRAARAAGLRTVGGMTMLEAQARTAFRLFFGVPAPPGGAGLFIDS